MKKLKVTTKSGYEHTFTEINGGFNISVSNDVTSIEIIEEKQKYSVQIVGRNNTFKNFQTMENYVTEDLDIFVILNNKIKDNNVESITIKKLLPIIK